MQHFDIPTVVVYYTVGIPVDVRDDEHLEDRAMAEAFLNDYLDVDDDILSTALDPSDDVWHALVRHSHYADPSQTYMQLTYDLLESEGMTTNPRSMLTA